MENPLIPQNSFIPQKALIDVRNLTVGYGTKIIQKDLTFSVKEKEIFVIMGGSGCGKSSLLRVLMGLLKPLQGTVLYGGRDFWQDTENRQAILQSIGVMFQGGALWTSRTLAENIAIPLKQYTKLNDRQIYELARYKLAQVGLSGFEHYYPSEISGGMRKRAGIARALALDPRFVFLDEPSAGLDPVSSAKLDELILQLRESLGMTVLIVTHELASIFTVADTAIWLDAKTKTMLAQGNPGDLVKNGPEIVRKFLKREAE